MKVCLGWLITLICLSQSTSGQAADDVQMETIRREVALQLNALREGRNVAMPAASSMNQSAEAETLSRLVSAEVTRQLYVLKADNLGSPDPAPTERIIAPSEADDDWYVIPTGTDSAFSRRGETKRSPQESERSYVPRAALAKAVGAVTADNPVRRSNNAIELNSSANGTQATIALSSLEREVGDPGGMRRNKSSWNLTATAPVDKNSGDATFASLTGLANGFNLGTGWKFSSDPRAFGTNTSDWSRLVAVRAAMGYDDFTYYTTLTDKKTDREMRWSVGASYGTTSPEKKFYFGAGFDVQHTYKGRAPRIVCPLSSNDPFDCVQGTFGPPRPGYQRIGYLEARSDLFMRPFSLRVSHDFASDLTIADLPIYLLLNKDKFSGGVRLGWSSDNDVVVGVFVGKDFTIN